MKTKFKQNLLRLSVIALVSTALVQAQDAQGYNPDTQQIQIDNPFYQGGNETTKVVTEEKRMIEVMNPPLENSMTSTDVKALEVAFDGTEKAENKTPPVMGNNGKVVYQYGQGQNTIICQVNQFCVIELEENEMLIDGYVSDTTRWDVEDTYKGTPENSQIMILIRPKDVNLDSTFIISTDRRVYSLKLKSSYDYTMPIVSFSYPNQFDNNGISSGISKSNVEKLASQKDARERSIAESKAAAERSRQAKINAANARAFEREKLNTTYGSPASSLNFNYQISGNAHFKPVRVYSMGHQTIIEFSPQISYGFG